MWNVTSYVVKTLLQLDTLSCDNLGTKGGGGVVNNYIMTWNGWEIGYVISNVVFNFCCDSTINIVTT